ncbi:MAG: type II secretion system protein M [Gammaproteobacteria bacterium]|nr:type II secretion system protein M [Gammaproteobacteria bacterium]
MSRIAALRARGLQALAASPAGRWYREQSPRDQWMLVLLAGFLLLVSVWLLVRVPVERDLAQAERSYQAARGDHLWILEHQDEAARAAGHSGRSGEPQTGQALLSTVAGSARRSGLTLNRFQPEGDDALAVSLDEVAFGEMLRWLETLEAEEGIRVRQASLSAADRPGHVRARLVLN